MRDDLDAGKANETWKGYTGFECVECVMRDRMDEWKP